MERRARRNECRNCADERNHRLSDQRLNRHNPSVDLGREPSPVLLLRHWFQSYRAACFAFAVVSASIAADALSVPSGCRVARTMTFEPGVRVACDGAIAVTETFGGTVIV